MSKEILDAVYELERQKSIDAEVLLVALEDALKAAYKKTPEAARHVRVEIDRGTGDMRVFQVSVPDEILIEKGLLHLPEPSDEDEEEAPATTTNQYGEEVPVEEPEPQLDWDRLGEADIDVVDVTPSNFGRIAAQTAKQVILERIREAEREMMFDEYQDRVGDVVTGIVQQSDNRYCLSTSARWRRCCPAPSRCPASATSTAPASRPSSSRCAAAPRDRRSCCRAAPRSCCASCSSSRCPRSPTASWSSAPSRASPATDRRSPSSRAPRGSTRSAPASARAGRGCAWSCPSCAARRSTSSRTTTSPPASSRRRSRRRASRRSSSTTTTSSRR